MSSPAFTLPAQETDETGPYALAGQARAQAGKAEALEAALIALVEPTRREEGVLQYHVHRDRADPDLFVFYEVWESTAHLEAHLSQPYVQDFLAKRQTLLDGDMDVRWLRMTSPYQA
ncbi:antibiotic biosynthesis monooxygenase [Shinella sp. CPCC 101442]|uniref:putative quinol monooxygenase n=1 Tax=Shinella sp. CPCC 101442 TaxID=2932265 RepID=UPI002153A5AD|nr:putative quinol monooxygenase [Shinella sp. CPCC 101442]MCR6498227.1 antibiotic biosynthesis monooxygenase [Shinella sp. CPCC 101442]